MKKLTVELKNCHGIRELLATFDFKKVRAAAVYAPNGTMKTSFALTFRDLSTGRTTDDRMFPGRQTGRSIKDEAGVPINASDVVVVLSYDEEWAPTESTSTLLVNSGLRKEYESLQLELNQAREELVAALKAQANTRSDVAKAVSLSFTKEDGNFLGALTRAREDVVAQEDAPFAAVPYDMVFNDKVLLLLRKPEIVSALSNCVTRLNELLDESPFFDRESFGYYNASNVTKSLGDNGFFAASHAVLLRSKEGEEVEVSDRNQLESLIDDEKQKISDDEGLRKNLEAIEKALNKNIETRAFYKYIAEHIELLAEFSNIGLFEQKVWKSYLKNCEPLYGNVIDCHRASERRKREIEDQAAKEGTQWENVIEIFNERFFVPFRLTAKNRERVVLGQEEILQLGFEFEEGEERAVVERNDLLGVLSNGEKKALYILNVLFEVETRKASGRDTIFVIDDIADSFDYKNKYAIIQYLKEMSEQENFKLIILTHNFDFFRAVEGRGVVSYKNCLMAQKNDERVILSPASGIRNPFINDFKPNFFQEGMKRVAAIPFIRNIVEYTSGQDDSEYSILTSLLHWKPDTISITQADLDRIFNKTFNGSGSWESQRESVVDGGLNRSKQLRPADSRLPEAAALETLRSAF